MTIHIDLKTALTDEAVAKARDHLGDCRYDAPCIIGAMLPPGTNTSPIEGMCVDALERNGLILFADERQSLLASELQAAFDRGDETEFDRMLEHVRAELGK